MLFNILNSKLKYFWLYFKGKKKGDILELYFTPLSKIPIKNQNENKLIKYIVDKVLSIKSSNNSSSYYENKIDALVFHLYGLTEVKMNQVLDTFKYLDTKDRTQIVNEYKNIINNKFRVEI